MRKLASHSKLVMGFDNTENFIVTVLFKLK